ncbi:hypothetical protein ACX1H4_19585 [Yersinia enterocolitica]|uniref:hypothetical protein n=1 Tax=Yersinia enterocolitica TaxID=630 RepID=UPI001C8E027C|nr:hypothetical protein [Yersinia enterocolitica]EKN4180600.1 hypothetical protein [Yersinia enterocolitica]MBX9488949.1 hypothetical protein [Yersinia enterocolitica]MBX9494212.1 hypothetical protein [Yersinia enterocolitica]HEN3447355.1 hypothetical protein [Yersinia enterocolitica]HEN3638886.1 hypothetical protein [Yersinia enterocolitica]
MQNLASHLSVSIRNGRILRRATIPAELHESAKLMARSRSISIGELYDEAVSELIDQTQKEAVNYIRVPRKNNPPKKSFWLSADLSAQAKMTAARDHISEHEFILTAILQFAQKHNFAYGHKA